MLTCLSGQYVRNALSTIDICFEYDQESVLFFHHLKHFLLFFVFVLSFARSDFDLNDSG